LPAWSGPRAILAIYRTTSLKDTTAPDDQTILKITGHSTVDPVTSVDLAQFRSGKTNFVATWLNEQAALRLQEPEITRRYRVRARAPEVGCRR
jgi:hypothetical protein